MKTRFLSIAGVLFFISVFSSCYWYHHNHDVAVSINDDENQYQLSAHFDDRKTKAVENFIKHCAERYDAFRSDGGEDLDATLILDDNARVYVKSREGRLKIKFNKQENSVQSYEKVKEMCEGIKEIIVKN